MKIVALVMVLAVGASAQVLESKTYSTSGRASTAVATADGQYVLVTVNGRGSAGIDVFRNSDGKLEKAGYQSLGGEQAQGMVVIPHTRMLAVGLSNAGVAFLSLDEAIAGKAKPVVLAEGEGSGSGYLAVSPDGQTLFVANEYGGGGNVGVIALHRDEAGKIAPQAVAQIPTPRATPGIAISSDGTRLYAAGEIIPPPIAAKWPGHGVKELERSGCTQAQQGREMANGALYTIDVAKAAALPVGTVGKDARAAMVSWMDAGCSPVREQESTDGKKLYVTARGDDRVLEFDSAKIVSDPQNALLRALETGGEAPVGLKLFDRDTKLLVANSNRFAGWNGSAAVIDLSTGKVVQKIKTGEFPRNIGASADGKTLYLSVFSSNELMVLKSK